MLLVTNTVDTITNHRLCVLLNFGAIVCLSVVKDQMFGDQISNVCFQLEHVSPSRLHPQMKTKVS